MSGNPLQLFLNRFLLVNKERYKDDALALNIINSLTLEEVVFSNWRGTQLQGVVEQKTTDIRADGKLTGTDQKYYTLDLASPLVTTPTETAPVEEADLPKQTINGLYLYNDTSVTPARLSCAIVINRPEDLVEEAKVIIKAACKFDLADEDIVALENGTDVLVTTQAFIDVVKLVAADLEFRYDGTRSYDGSVTY